MDFRSKLVDEINFVRISPQAYADKLMSYEKNFKDKVFRIPGQTAILTNEGFPAFKEAAKQLKTLKPLPPVTPNQHLNKIAEDSLKYAQNDSQPDLNELIEKYGQIIGAFSQATDFGSSNPELVILNLIVDDGDSNRGNRQNILNSKFKIVGSANGNHKNYKFATVITYARHFFANGEEIGQLSDDCYETGPKKSQKPRISNSFQHVEMITTVNEGKNNNGDYVYVEEKKEVYSASNKDKKKESKHIEPEADDDFNLPEGVIKIDRQEKVVIESGITKKIIKLTKHFEDGTIQTEIFKKTV